MDLCVNKSMVLTEKFDIGESIARPLVQINGKSVHHINEFFVVYPDKWCVTEVWIGFKLGSPKLFHLIAWQGCVLVCNLDHLSARPLLHVICIIGFRIRMQLRRPRASPCLRHEIKVPTGLDGEVGVIFFRQKLLVVDSQRCAPDWKVILAGGLAALVNV